MDHRCSSASSETEKERQKNSTKMVLSRSFAFTLSDDFNQQKWKIIFDRDVLLNSSLATTFKKPLPIVKNGSHDDARAKGLQPNFIIQKRYMTILPALDHFAYDL